jgi:hypothetical protein
MVDLDEMKLDELEKVVDDLAKQLDAAMKIASGVNCVTKIADGVVSFNQCAQEIKKRDACGHIEALRRARLEHPEEFAAFQNFGNLSARPTQTVAKKVDPVRAFEDIVRGIARDRKVPLAAAMSLARREHPAEFQAYNNQAI